VSAPALAVSLPGRGRFYQHPVTKDYYVSVTNVIDVLAKPWLGAWAAKMVAGEAWDQRFALSRLNDRDQAVDMLKGAPYRKRDRAAGVGDVIHAFAESLSTDEPTPDIAPEHEPYIDALGDFLKEYDPEFLITEGTIFSAEDPEGQRYAGTFDWLGKIGRYLLLADWKTGANVYAEVALQMAALRNGAVVWDRVTGDLLEMPKVDGCIAVHVRPKKFAVHVIDTSEQAYQAFLGLRSAWPWTKDQSAAVGPRMNKLRLVREVSSGASAGETDTAGRPAPSLAPDESSPADETEGEATPESPATGPATSTEVAASPAGDQAVLGG
jgi:hypothetical protein